MIKKVKELLMKIWNYEKLDLLLYCLTTICLIGYVLKILDDKWFKILIALSLIYLFRSKKELR